MLHANNTQNQRGVVRGALIALGLVLVLGPAIANAQPVTDAQVRTQEVAAADAIDAYQRVDRWVRSWEIDQDPSGMTAHRGFCVVAVTIRADGRVLGRGILSSMDPDDQLLWRTARLAMHRAGVHLPTEIDAGWEEDRAAMIRSMTITLELASSMIEIPDSEHAMPDFGHTPASVGIALRSGENLEAMSIDTMLMQGIGAQQAVGSLAVALTGDGAHALSETPELIEQGFVPYRFVQTTLAQPAPGFGPEFLDRGTRVVSNMEINTTELRAMGVGIANHLRAQRWAGIERYGVMGTLDPVSGKHTPSIASSFEQALAALALLRYGALGETESHQLARKGGRDILRDLSVSEPGEPVLGDDLVAVALCVAALAEIDPQVIEISPELMVLLAQSVVNLQRGYDPIAGFHPSIPEGARGLVAWGLVRGSSMDSQIDRADAESAVRAVFRETPAAKLVGQMPFLGWAELESAGVGAIPAGVALSDMRQLVWDHTLRATDLDRVDRDLDGGIVFTASRTPLPSWHGLRPLAFIATMLGHEQLTPGSVVSGRVPAEIGELVHALRFVRQLCATGPVLRMYPRREASAWGTRASLWDQTMPIESSAMALLVTTETLRSLDQLAARKSPETVD